MLLLASSQHTCDPIPFLSGVNSLTGYIGNFVSTLKVNDHELCHYADDATHHHKLRLNAEGVTHFEEIGIRWNASQTPDLYSNIMGSQATNGLDGYVYFTTAYPLYRCAATVTARCPQFWAEQYLIFAHGVLLCIGHPCIASLSGAPSLGSHDVAGVEASMCLIH
jgi:hypothetical protein